MHHHPSNVHWAVNLKTADASIVKVKNTYHVSVSPDDRWRDMPSLDGQCLHMPSDSVSVSVVTVTQFAAADPVLKLKLEPLVCFPPCWLSHGSSIIMGLACNPVTSPKKQTERATSTHAETLSHYCKPQRGFICTHCILIRQFRSARDPSVILLSLTVGQLLWVSENLMLHDYQKII